MARRPRAADELRDRPCQRCPHLAAGHTTLDKTCLRPGGQLMLINTPQIVLDTLLLRS